MKKTNIKEQIETIFQIIGEENNISNNFKREEYSKLDETTKNMFDETLDFKFNEPIGIIRNDFQRAVNILNKILKKEYGFTKTINNASDFLMFNSKVDLSNFKDIESNKKAKKRSLFKRIINRFKKQDSIEKINVSENDVFVSNTKSNTETKTINNVFFPNSFGLDDNETKTANNVFFPDSFGLEDLEKKETMVTKSSVVSDEIKKDNISEVENATELDNKKTTYDYIHDVPVFKKPKKEETEIMVPDSFELEENKENDKLSKQIEETKKSLQQVKDNIAKLKQKESVITEELNSLNQDIAEQENIINQELHEKDNEFATLISNEEKLPKGSFNDNDIVETEFIDNNPKDDLENQINKNYKPKHLKREDKLSEDEKKQKIEEDIKSCENMIEILQYKTILPETDEQKQYVKDKIKIYKNKLRRLKEQQKKQDLSNFDYQFAIRRKKLVDKLNKLEKNDTNQRLISDIEIAISQIDSYMKYSDAYKNGFISEDELNNKGNNTYMIVDYVMNERQKRTRK